MPLKDRIGSNTCQNFLTVEANWCLSLYVWSKLGSRLSILLLLGGQFQWNYCTLKPKRCYHDCCFSVFTAWVSGFTSNFRSETNFCCHSLNWMNPCYFEPYYVAALFEELFFSWPYQKAFDQLIFKEICGCIFNTPILYLRLRSLSKSNGKNI